MHCSMTIDSNWACLDSTSAMAAPPRLLRDTWSPPGPITWPLPSWPTAPGSRPWFLWLAGKVLGVRPTSTAPASRPAVLRCSRFCLPIHEQFRRCNMSLASWLFPQRVRFLRPPRTFSHRLQTDLVGQIKQEGRQVCRAHRIKHVPLWRRNRDHHPMIGRRNFVGDIVQRHLCVHGLFAINPTQRRQHYR